MDYNFIVGDIVLRDRRFDRKKRHRDCIRIDNSGNKVSKKLYPELYNILKPYNHILPKINVNSYHNANRIYKLVKYKNTKKVNVKNKKLIIVSTVNYCVKAK